MWLLHLVLLNLREPVDEGNQFESANSKKTNTTIITDVLDPSDDNTDDSTDSEINEYTEIPQYVSLTINFGEPQSSSARSMARTAIGTFEEIEALYVNAQRQDKNSFLYISPGRPLTKINDGSWICTCFYCKKRNRRIQDGS